MMFLRAALFLAIFIACQCANTKSNGNIDDIVNIKIGNNTKPHTISDEIRDMVDLVRLISNMAITRFSRSMSNSMAMIVAASGRAEEKGHELVDEYMRLAYQRINKTKEHYEEENLKVDECINCAKNHLTLLSERYNLVIKGCGKDTRYESSRLVRNALEAFEHDEDAKPDVYIKQLAFCTEKDDNSCLEDLLTAIIKEVNYHPQETGKLIDVARNTLNVIEASMDNCVHRVDVDSAKEIEETVNEMTKCIKVDI